MNLQDKTAIVTGSSMGIGKRIAEQLAEHGANVVLNARQEERLQQAKSELLAKGLNVAAFQGDVSDPLTCKGLIEFAVKTYGSLDILVNNVGVGTRGQFEGTNPEVFRYVINSNVLGVVYPTLAGLPYLKQAKGSIILISSLAGFRGIPNSSVYCMSKRALSSLAESLQIETAKDGLHIGIIYVGMTQNDPDKQVLYADGHWEKLASRQSMFVDAPEVTANAVLEAIEHRRFETIIGIKGKAYYWLQRLAPWLVDFTFKHQSKRVEAAQR